MFPADRLSVNPLAYWMSGTAIERTPEIMGRAFGDSARAGFARVKADVPEGMTPAAYVTWLAQLGVTPGISMFMSTFDRTTPIAEDVERARRYADSQVALGATATMICAIFVPERVRAPAIGAEFDETRLDRVIDDLGAVSAALTAEGIRPLLHPHVAGWIETEYETERVLGELDDGILGFGPDTGHLAWAGMDPVAMTARHARRVGAVHLKDVQPGALQRSNDDYRQRTASRSVWCEPGLGTIDFDGVFAALPVGFGGEFVIEVDVPTVTAYRSLELSRRWAERYFA